MCESSRSHKRQLLRRALLFRRWSPEIGLHSTLFMSVRGSRLLTGGHLSKPSMFDVELLLAFVEVWKNEDWH